MPTAKECQTILFNLGIKLGVSPKLISERLLSLNDKRDMMGGSFQIVELEANIVAWKESGMPDYSHGLTDTLDCEKNRLKLAEIYKESESGRVYNKPFVEYRESE